jgi:NADH-ubiquinone oxidoreductase chain 6
MSNLFILSEIATNGLNYDFLNIIFIVSILCGILVIISKNPIVSVLFLIGLFISIAGYLMMLGINFIGLSYLLVYVGAVSILFLFILMLINVRISELVTNNSNSIPLAIIISIFVNINQLFPGVTSIPAIYGSNTLPGRYISDEKLSVYIDSSLDKLSFVTSHS